MIKVNDYVEILRSDIESIAYDFKRATLEIDTKGCTITICPYEIYEYNKLINKMNEGE